MHREAPPLSECRKVLLFRVPHTSHTPGKAAAMLRAARGWQHPAADSPRKNAFALTHSAASEHLPLCNPST